MSYRQLRTQADPAPNRVNPVEEHVQGEDWNNAYRGMEDHGVRGEKATDVPGYDHERMAYQYIPEAHEVDPVPVRIVQQYSKELRKFRVVNVTVPTSSVVQLCGRNETRTKVSIKNMAASGFIWLGAEPFMTNDVMGYAIASRQEFSLTTEDPVYCYAATADSQVCVLEEYTVSE